MRVYLFLSFLLDPMYLIYQYISVLRGKESSARFWERWVDKKIKRPSGKLIWFHSASVGETLSVIPLIKKLIKDDPEVNILITSTTMTSAQIFEKKPLRQVTHQMAPHDTFFVSRRFLNYWKPDLAIRVESEIWPRILLELKKNETPNFLFNARFSKKTLSKIQQQAESSAFLLSLFDCIHVQESSTKKILSQVGVDVQKISVTGSLKDGRKKLPANKNDLKKFKKVIGSQKVWLAASTHPGEDEVILAAHKKVGGILLIAPRHIERAKQIARLSSLLGFKTQLRSEEPDIKAETSVYIADTMGEMGLWYSLTSVVFVGGSLVEKGGHNPVEVAQFNKYILHGPNTYNALERYEQLRQAGICFLVKNESELVKEILRVQNSIRKFNFDLNSIFDPENALNEALNEIKLVTNY